ncbi:hypothetical protein G6F65_021800 [Rhizopus arrhizus]|nr:hypothetical protein G6F65_021800 [Rhizopus arrhizus]
MSALLAVRDRIHALWAPQQDGDHQRDIREQGGFGHKEAGVVGHQAHQQRPDQATDRRPQRADHVDDDYQRVHL